MSSQKNTFVSPTLLISRSTTRSLINKGSNTRVGRGGSLTEKRHKNTESTHIIIFSFYNDSAALPDGPARVLPPRPPPHDGAPVEGGRQPQRGGPEGLPATALRLPGGALQHSEVPPHLREHGHGGERGMAAVGIKYRVCKGMP